MIARDARGRFVSARRELHTDVGSDDGEEILETADSLVWDGHQQPLLNLTAGTRRWSVDTQHSVPAPDADLADERLADCKSCLHIPKGERVQPVVI